MNHSQTDGALQLWQVVYKSKPLTECGGFDQWQTINQSTNQSIVYRSRDCASLWAVSRHCQLLSQSNGGVYDVWVTIGDWLQDCEHFYLASEHPDVCQEQLCIRWQYAPTLPAGRRTDRQTSTGPTVAYRALHPVHCVQSKLLSTLLNHAYGQIIRVFKGPVFLTHSWNLFLCRFATIACSVHQWRSER